MAESLFALKKDLDMVVQDLQELKKAFNLLDYIAKVVHDSELEQLAQAAQMRRIEAGISELRGDIVEIKKDIAEMKQSLSSLDGRVGRLEERVGRLEESKR